jgi:diamine N-acetyltransferase
MAFTHEHITLRALEPADVELLYHWENNPDVWRVSNSHMPVSKFILANYIKTSDRDIWESKELRLIIEYKSQPVGSIEVFDFDPYHMRAGIGIIVFDEYMRQKGIAKGAIQLLFDYLKNEVGVFQVYANIADDNLPSIGLFEKMGFQLIGVKNHWLKTPGGWKNERMYQFIL